MSLFACRWSVLKFPLTFMVVIGLFSDRHQLFCISLYFGVKSLTSVTVSRKLGEFLGQQSHFLVHLYLEPRGVNA